MPYRSDNSFRRKVTNVYYDFRNDAKVLYNYTRKPVHVLANSSDYILRFGNDPRYRAYLGPIAEFIAFNPITEEVSDVFSTVERYLDRAYRAGTLIDDLLVNKLGIFDPNQTDYVYKPPGRQESHLSDMADQQSIAAPRGQEQLSTPTSPTSPASDIPGVSVTNPPEAGLPNVPSKSSGSSKTPASTPKTTTDTHGNTTTYRDDGAIVTIHDPKKKNTNK